MPTQQPVPSSTSGLQPFPPPPPRGLASNVRVTRIAFRCFQGSRPGDLNAVLLLLLESPLAAPRPVAKPDFQPVSFSVPFYDNTEDGRSHDAYSFPPNLSGPPSTLIFECYNLWSNFPGSFSPLSYARYSVLVFPRLALPQIAVASRLSP